MVEKIQKSFKGKLKRIRWFIDYRFLLSVFLCILQAQ